jgi:uncharacterized protein YmfQ (DUF2313 family)
MTHADILKLLFPVKDMGGVFDQDVAIEGSYLDALKTSADNLLLELFPDTCTTLTIGDWERTYAIIPPDGATLDARRLAVVQKKRLRRKLTRAYFVSLAATVGYAISIEEIPPNAADYGGVWSTIYIWRVHVPIGAKNIVYFTAGDSSAGDLLTDWSGENVLENLFNALKPAHTRVLFVYE